MSHACIGLLGLALSLPCAEAAAQAPAAVAVDPLALVPADALFVAHIPDAGALKAALGTNAHYRFLTEPTGLASALGKDFEEVRLALLLDPTDDQLASMEDELRAMSEVVRSVQGSATFFLVHESSEETSWGVETWGTIVRPGAGMAEFESTLNRMAAEQGDQMTVSFRDGLRVLEPVPQEDETGLREVAVFGPDLFLFLATGYRGDCRPRLEALLAALEGGASSIQGDAAWEQAHAAAGFQHHAFAWFDVQGMLEEFRGGIGNDEPTDDERFASYLGVDEIDWVIAGANVGKGESLDFELLVDVPDDRPLGTLLGAMKPLPLEMLGHLPAEACSVTALAIDPAELLDASVSVANGFVEGSGDVAEAQLDSFSDMFGVDLQEDVIRALTGEIVSYRLPLGPWTPEDVSTIPRWLLHGNFLGGLHDASVLEGSLEDLIEAGAQMIGADVDVEAVGGPEGSPGTFAVRGMPRPWFWGFTQIGARPVLATSGDAERLAALVVGPPAGASVVDSDRLGPVLRESAGASWIQAGLTAETFGELWTGVDLWMSMRSASDAARLGAEWFSNYFQGTTASSLERLPGRVRFHFRTR